MTTYITRKDGQWFGLNRRGHMIACCDCGLVHFVRLRIKNGRMQMQAWRDNRRTAARRRNTDLIARTR